MARFESTSFMFMLDWVPEPVCQTTSGNSSSYLPCTTSAAAAAMASARRGSSLPRSLFTRAAACFTMASAWTSGSGIRSSPMRKFWSERCVCAPQSLSAANLDGAEGICFGAG